MKRKLLIIIAGCLLVSVWAYGQQVYKWVDEKGETHFTDDLGKVPEKYREQAAEKISREKPPAVPPVGTSQEESHFQQKDALARGEEWWKAKVKEWNNKLKKAEKDLTEAQETLKQKEQELEETQFSHQRRRHGIGLIPQLETDIENLREKITELEKQVEEAKNMLEKVLPQDAKDSGANPNWLIP